MVSLLNTPTNPSSKCLWVNELSFEQATQITFEKVEAFIHNTFNKRSFDVIKSIVT